jgi:hypothetical protein
MKNEKSNGKMWDRVDGFRSLKAGESMPGRLEWSVGYFTKVRLISEAANLRGSQVTRVMVKMIEWTSRPARN